MKTIHCLALSALALLAAACTAPSVDDGALAVDRASVGAEATALASTMPAVVVEIVGRGSGLCLDVAGVSTADFALLQQWGCGGGQNQSFRLHPVGDGSYTIEASHSGKCLDVYGWDTGNYAVLHQYTCTGGTNQRFTFNKLTSGDYQIKAVHGGRCMNVADFSTQNGGRIQQYDCNEDSNESFILRRKSAPTKRALVVLLENGGYLSGLPANPSANVPSFSCRGIVVTGVSSAQAAVDRFLADRNLVGAASWYMRQVLGMDFTCVSPSSWSQTTVTVPVSDIAAPYINRTANTFTQATVSAALGGAYDTVQFLVDGTMQPIILRGSLEGLAIDHRVDVHVLTHGNEQGFGVGGASWFKASDIRGLGNVAGLDLRAVYQMNCYGAALNSAWTFAGADVVSGSRGINYAPSSYFDFIVRWRAGTAFSSAVSASYDSSLPAMSQVYSRIDLFDERSDGDHARSPAQVDLPARLSWADEAAATRPDFSGNGWVTLR